VSLREEHRLKVFENCVLRRILGLKRDESNMRLEKLALTMNFIICTLHQM
jgi:hypothetical protein